VAKFLTGSRTGTIVGVIGGYQEGGDTPSLSYSVRFWPAIRSLYRQAVAAESPGSSRPAEGNPDGTGLRDSPRPGRDRHGGSR
jgi:hypothetical protein